MMLAIACIVAVQVFGNTSHVSPTFVFVAESAFIRSGIMKKNWKILCGGILNDPSGEIKIRR